MVDYICGLSLVIIGQKLWPVSRKMWQFHLNMNIEGTFWRHTHKETGMLVYPTEVFVDYIESLETRFTLVFAAVMHMTGVMRRLYKNMDGLSDGVLHCTNSSCLAKLCAMTKLYIKVRLHHALKLSNRQHKVAGGKRNRKMLKLSHL